MSIYIDLGVLGSIFIELYTFFLSRSMADITWSMTSCPLKSLTLIYEYILLFGSLIMCMGSNFGFNSKNKIFTKIRSHFWAQNTIPPKKWNHPCMSLVKLYKISVSHWIWKKIVKEIQKKNLQNHKVKFHVFLIKWPKWPN